MLPTSPLHSAHVMSDPVTRLNAALEDRYHIERELGEGGMATVYLAVDLRHDRKVALKVLRPELAAVVGGERFLAEITTTANLQHPHILPLFDSGEADGFLFYVMPYVEGESLRERLDRERQLPVDEAVKLTRKVADALDHAHERGVVHRDVKPANILLSERGEPLVADFGIALAVSQAGGGRITETGLSLGTPHYMSPEQASGDQTVDRRTDVYALGCVLYEALAGEPPYTGTTSQAILARILTTDAERVMEVRSSVPLHVDAAVAKALEKLPADRFGSAASFAEALQDATYRYTTGHGEAAVAVGPGVGAGDQGRRATVVAAPALAGLVAGGLLTAAAFLLLGGEEESAGSARSVPPTRFVVDLGERPVDDAEFDLSLDGSMLVYASDGDGPLYVRAMDDPEPRPVLGTDGADWPVFSPDGAWIAYRDRDDVLRRIAVGGGAPLRVTPGSPRPITLHWGDDGTLVFAREDGLYRVPAQGGEPERMLAADAPFHLRFPRLLPGGEALLYTDTRGLGRPSAVHLLDMRTGETTLLVEDASDARYLQTGHIVYGHSGSSLLAAPFDLRRLRIGGEPFPVLDDVLIVPDLGAAAFASSSVGTVAYFSGGGVADDRFRIALADSAGTLDPLPMRSPLLYAPRFSPDGRKLAYENRLQIHVHDLVLGTTVRIPAEGRHNLPVWMPSGDSIVFGCEAPETAGFDLCRASADGAGDPETLWSAEGAQYPESWDPEGRRLLFTSVTGPEQNHDLLVLDLEGEPEVVPYLRADWDELRGRISPDGRWVAYDSDEEGTTRVYVRAFPEPGPSRTVSEGAGESSRWAPDGETLYYWRGDTLVAARIETEPSFQVVSRSDVLVGPFGEEFDVRPDATGFVFSGSSWDESEEGAGDGEVEERPELHVVVNWFEELRTRAGGLSRER